jgi:hypothetical protein
MVEKLNENNFLLYAMNHYDNPQCHSLEEFDEDLKKFLYLKKLITRYKKDNDLKERLILNHIIVLYNVFGANATRMLFHKVDKDNWDVLVTFLIYLGHMPESIPEYNLILSDIKLDEKVIAVLRKLTNESTFRQTVRSTNP